MKVAIVTDSTADLDAADARERGIDVVPLFVAFGDASYRDNIDLTRDEFYRKLASLKVLPTTSQPAPAMFEDAFRPHVEAGRPVVCVTIMSTLSGTMNAATTAAKAFPGAEIHIVDSESVAGGLALLAQHASEVANAGGDAQAVLATLAHDIAVLRGFATIPDLSHAVRTGRVSRAQAFVGSLVKIVPVLRIEHGKVEEQARVRTFARAIDAMVDAVVGRSQQSRRRAHLRDPLARGRRSGRRRRKAPREDHHEAVRVRAARSRTGARHARRSRRRRRLHHPGRQTVNGGPLRT